MIHITKKIKTLAIPSLFIVMFLLVSLYGTAQVYADDTPNFLEKLAQKFNLKKEDVKEFYEQERAYRWEARRTNLETRLSQLVAEGKITEEQKQKILAKKEELRAEQEAQRLEHQNELEAWAKENNIDTQYLFGNGMGMGRGMHNIN